MTPQDIERAARALYEACPTTKPKWDQLGAVTQSVWQGRVGQAAQGLSAPVVTGRQVEGLPEEGQLPDDESASPPTFEGQGSLF